MRTRLLLFVLILTFQSVKAKVYFGENCKLTYASIINYDFATAKALLLKEQQEHPGNLSINYLKHLQELLRLYLTEDEAAYQRFVVQTNRTIEKLKDEQEGAYRDLMIGELYLFRGVLKLKFQENLSAALNVLKAKNAIEKCAEDFPDFVPVKLSLGVLHAFIGAVPNQYKPYLSMLGFRGTVAQGMKEIDRVRHSSEVYLKDIAGLLQSFVVNELTSNEVLNLSQYQISMESLMSQCYQAMLWTQNGKSEKAVSLLNENLNRYKSLEIYFPYYLLGKAKLFRLDKDADLALLEFVKHYKGKNYLKSAHLYLAMHYFLKDEIKHFEYHKSQIGEVGFDFVGADQQALRRLQKWPEKTLLKAQLLYDGGLYLQSITELSKFSKANLADDVWLECNYRLASNYLKLGQLEKAQVLIDKLLLIENSRDYFQPNAALKFAVVCEAKGDISKALIYYNKVLMFENYPYEKSISQKAKAGLIRLSN